MAVGPAPDADHPTPHAASGPTTTEAFTADREMFWGTFTRTVVYAVVALVVLLVLMAIFLV